MCSSNFGQSVPQLVNYQGRLANSDGSPFPTADYYLSFSIYDSSTNGSLIWGPQTFDGGAGKGRGLRIPVVQGYFSVMLGPVDIDGRRLADAFGSSNRFVEVTVSNRPPVLPRQQILSTPYAIQAANGAPPGTIVAFGGDVVPDGWILCDGRPLSRNVYPRLFEAIGSSWGNASDDNDQATDFRAPDFRGLFLRGVDASPLMGPANRDPDRTARGKMWQDGGGNSGNTVGSIQADSFQGHHHLTRYSSRYSGYGNLGSGWESNFAPDEQDAMTRVPFVVEAVSDGVNGSPRVSPETRPKNAYVQYIIKY